MHFPLKGFTNHFSNSIKDDYLRSTATDLRKKKFAEVKALTNKKEHNAFINLINKEQFKGNSPKPWKPNL